MNNGGTSKSQIFLLEFIIVVLFFAICATICTTAFVRSDSLSRENAAKNEAISRVESAAEIVKYAAEGVDPVEAAGAALKEHMDATEIYVNPDPAGAYRLFAVLYDEDFKALNLDEAQKSEIGHELYIQMMMDGDMMKAVVSMDGNPISEEGIFVLNVEKYVPLAGSEGPND